MKKYVKPSSRIMEYKLSGLLAVSTIGQDDDDQELGANGHRGGFWNGVWGDDND